MTSAPDRFEPWLESLEIAVEGIEALAGDVSPRRYFRIQTDAHGDAIVAVYPEDSTRDSERFLASTELFADAGIRVPRVLAANPRQGMLLLEDLGSVSLFDPNGRPWDETEPLLDQALEISKKLSRRPQPPYRKLNPPLDAHRLGRELNLARDVFLDEPAFSGSSNERAALTTALDRLCLALEAEVLVPTHRDFMSRNLMLPAGDGGRLAVIDHQDACLAPRFYDAASVLNDSVNLSWPQESALISSYLADENDLRAYRRCAVQRTIKASSTFVRFALMGFDRHLPLVAPSLAKAAQHLAALPEGGMVPRRILERWSDSSSVDEAVQRLAGRSQDENARVVDPERPH